MLNSNKASSLPSVGSYSNVFTGGPNHQNCVGICRAGNAVTTEPRKRELQNKMYRFLKMSLNTLYVNQNIACGPLAGCKWELEEKEKESSVLRFLSHLPFEGKGHAFTLLPFFFSILTSFFFCAVPDIKREITPKI